MRTKTVIKEKITFDFDKNPKQYAYFLKVVEACNGINQLRKFCYGGAIRGGKTFVTLFILIYLCNRYKGSRWVVVRNDFPNLQKTTIESLKKLLHNSPDWTWNRDKGNFFVSNKYGSRIYFMGENITRDPDLNDFLGLECNGVFMEQLEEISYKCWQILNSRVGSWYIDDMPPAFTFTTFNPTQRWPKQFIYERYQAKTLPAEFHYQTALPSDNGAVTKDQWNQWMQMDSRYQKQFIEGDWTDFDDTDPRWLYAFDEKKHVRPTLPFLRSYPVYLGWDFNRDPLTCVAMQKSPILGRKESFMHFIKEFQGPYTLQEICQQIRAAFPASILFVTGDVSGRQGSIVFENRNMTHYKLIQQYLQLSDKQIQLNAHNLEHSDSRLLINTVLNVYPHVAYSQEGCPNLIHECKYAKVDVEHRLPGHLKKDREDNKLDLFDGHRYIYQTYMKPYIDKVYFQRRA